MLIAINYHYIRPSFNDPYPGIHGITPARFKSQMKALSKIGEFVSGAAIQAAIRGEQNLPARAFIVTFDDGLREQYEYTWQILLRLGISGIFFVNTGPIATATVATVHKIHLLRANTAPADFMRMLHRQAQIKDIELATQIDHNKAVAQYRYDTPDVAELKYLLNFLIIPEQRDQLIEACFQERFPGQEAEISRRLYLDTDQIQKLGSYGAIGSHAHEHLPLGLLPGEKIKEQIHLSLDYLQKWAGYRPYAMSYPYGSKEASSLAVGNVATSLGIDFAFTTERAANIDLNSPLFLARFDNNDLPGGKAARWSLTELFDSAPISQMHREPVPNL